MGIDIYARWDGMTKKEEKAQYTGYDVESGHVGYLREAYHGKPYATMFLLKEVFESDDDIRIPASVLRERLPETIALVIKREKLVYKEIINEDAPIVKSFENFVELCEKKEKETGKPVKIHVSY